MQSHPTSATEALSGLLRQWVDESFPTSRRSDSESALLVSLWRDVAVLLRGPEAPEVAAFVRESGHQTANGAAGNPPVRALEGLLRSVIDGGLREYFLVVAVRQALDRMITDRFPQAAEAWEGLSENALPLWLQFGLGPDEGPSAATTHAIGS